MPCRPGTKIPLTTNGLKDASSDEFQIELWWGDNPTANVAIVTDGLLIVDRDTDHETGAKNRWLSNDPCLMDLFAGPVATTPRGGDHAWFRQPIGKTFRNTASKLAPGVDTRASGGYVLVYPSIVDGKPYQWLETNQLDCSPENLPTPPQWLLDLLEDKPKATATPSTPSAIAEGGRNDQLARYAGYLRRGGSDEGEILAALQARNASKCNPPLPDDEVRQIARKIARYEPDQIQELIIEGVDDPPEEASKDPGPFPARLLDVPGFITQVMRFNLAGAIRPQPELALAGALALLAAITGRKVAGETRLRTNLYVIGLCETGGGKDRSLQTNKELLMAAEMARFIPMEDLASGAALVNAMKHQPAILLQIDEIGKFLRATKDAGTNPHLAEVVTILMKFFSCAGSFYSGKGYADTDKKHQIVNPHCCLYGVSVPQSVLESISVENMTDGFLSRLMIFEASNNNPHAIRYPQFDEPGQDLIDELLWWDAYQPGTGNLSGINTPQPRIIFDGPGVNDLFFEAEEWYRGQRESGDPAASLWTRAAEKARKLALLYQLSADRESCELTPDAARWGLDVVLHLTQRMIFTARDWVSDSKVGADKNKIVRQLRERGPQSISQLMRGKLQHLKSRDIQDAINDLFVAGLVTQGTATIRGKDVVQYSVT